MFKRLRRIGPGAIVAAAFIGPGTVTTATMAGASYGYTLLWAVLFSLVATLVLQEMSARLGVAGGMGIGSALRQKITRPVPRIMVSILVVGAILVGNAAYEAGNISGAALGFGYFLPAWQEMVVNPLVIILGMVVFALLYSGKYKLIEGTLVSLVFVMALVFLTAALYLSPDLIAITRGLFTPTVEGAGIITVLGLIGTTVVPYNLFLHASSVRQRWTEPDDLPAARWDTVLSISIGGLVTMAILVTAAAAFEGQQKVISSGADLAEQLVPMLGSYAYVVIAAGFFAAGISSAVTAPLAAAFAASELFAWQGKGMRDRRFRLVWGGILFTGILFSSLGIRPTSLILFAQVANGLILPLVAFFLLWVMNDRKIMGRYVNPSWINVMGSTIILLTLALGMKAVLSGLQTI